MVEKSYVSNFIDVAPFDCSGVQDQQGDFVFLVSSIIS